MNKQELKSSMILIVAAMIWGFAFVAQRVGGRYVPPLFFNGLRFLLGSLSLLPLLLFREHRSHAENRETPPWRFALPGGIVAGCILFIAGTLQQAGIAYTTAGKAGFITDLYIVIVPLLGLFFHRKLKALTWVSIFIAVAGLYFISVTSRFTISGGDLLELAGALFWSFHILVIDHFVKKTDALRLSFLQFVFCAGLSLAAGALFEQVTLQNILRAGIPLLYGGICSVGVAYTLQTIGQKTMKPSHSAIILSLESVFSCIGGALLLGENLGVRGYFGCALMVAGMVLSQLPAVRLKGIRPKRLGHASQEKA